MRALLAGSIEGVTYPDRCPHCMAAATVPIAITKVFQYHPNDEGNGGGGWQYRIAEAAPLFCAACAQRHHAETLPVTAADRLKSVLLTQLALPGFGTLALGLFLLSETATKIARNPAREWLLLVIIGVLLLIGVSCLRAAWTGNAHRRVPRQTATSLAFDFGDDASTAFQTVPRTYAFGHPDYAASFTALNEQRSRTLLGPKQRHRENLRTMVTALIVAALAALGWWFSRT
ncbi:MAG: hypothetical protein ABW187_04760 [Dokdonella sp.]